MDDPILVTGAARSGIQLIAGILHLCGAWTNRDVAITAYDVRGIFDNREIRDSVVKPFVKGMKADPLGQFPLPDIGLCVGVSNKVAPIWRRRIDKIIQKQGYTKGSWLFASPLSCLIWPVWREAFPNAQWILVRRKDDEIIRSCMMTGFMTAYETEKGWRQWLDIHKERFSEMVKAGLQLWQIWPHRMIQDKLAELHALVDHLGLCWNKEAIKDSIAPILWEAGIFEVDNNKSGGRYGK